MKKIRKFLNLSLIVGLFLVLTACGGGGSSDDGGNKVLSDITEIDTIKLEGAEFDSSFDATIISHDATVTSDDGVCVITVVKKEDAQTVSFKERNSDLKLNQDTYPVTMGNSDEKIIDITITAEDGISTNSYSISLSMKTELGQNAYLSSLNIIDKANNNSIVLKHVSNSSNTGFSKTEYNYTSTVANDVENINISITTEDDNATASLNGQNILAGDYSLAVGKNTFTVTVISEDTTVTKVYKVEIERSAEVISGLLNNLEISSGNIKETFSSTKYEGYTALIEVESITVKPTAVDSRATITVSVNNGSEEVVSSGSNSSSISFNRGDVKLIKVKVVGSSTNTYELTVTRQNNEEPGEAYLSALSTSAGSLAFNRSTFKYNRYTVSNSVSSITVTPTTEDTTASVTINGVAANSAQANTVALTEGVDNLVDITVTDGTNSKTYLFIVTREGVSTGYTGTGRKINIDDAAGWGNISVYYYNDASTTCGTWPGKTATLVTGETNQYYVVMDESWVTDNTMIIIKGDGGRYPADGADGMTFTGKEGNYITGQTFITPGGSVWTEPVRPVITITPDPGEVSLNQQVTFTATAGDGSIVSCGHVADGTKKTNFDSITISQDCKIFAYAVNSVGGVTISDLCSYTMPTSKPSIIINPTSGEFTNTIGVDITVSAEDSKEYNVDGAGWKTLTVSHLDLGGDKDPGESVTLQVRATNTFGTTTSALCTYTKKEEETEIAFDWNNATIYFVITDRFYNGTTSNDRSYNRKKDYGSDTLNTGTFHGGDIKGLTEKLDYLDEVGVNAIWLTAPYEQSHGWTGGANNNTFPHYGYHGYYPLDFTEMDKNMGTIDEMRTLVTEAHKRGIRVIMDIVMNHAGYHTLLDCVQFNYGLKNSMSENDAVNWSSGWDYHNNFDYNNKSAWSNWWGESWLRAGVNDIYQNGMDYSDDYPLISSTSSLPDFKTEVTNSVGLPKIMQNKWSDEGSSNDDWVNPSAKRLGLRSDAGIAPGDYLVKWLASWVEEFGIDGFRCDTAKHVDMFRWKQLNNECDTALQNWRNSSRSDNDPAKEWTDSFWTTAEHFNYNNGSSSRKDGKDYYYDGGFDSVIDFGYKNGIPLNYSSMVSSYGSANKKLLPYISSHDTGALFWNGDSTRQKNAGTALLLRPGAVQIFYGDEIGRNNGTTGGDDDQQSRSDFEWDKVDNDINKHWKKIGAFRKNHVAVGAGTHTVISGTTFKRVKDDDKVVIRLGGSGSINVSSVWSDGTKVRNAYNDTEATVSGGSVSFSGDVVLIEEAN